MSVAAQVLQARKNLENWPLWIAANGVAVNIQHILSVTEHTQDGTEQTAGPTGGADAHRQPITDVQVKIEMLQHEYAFGTAIDERKIAGNKNQNNTYQNKLFNLDGKGHGFSEVVYENGLKWPAWEGT